MKFISTRGKTSSVSFSESLLMGLAPDGGLLVPERFPDFSGELRALSELSFPDLGKVIAGAFAAGDKLSADISAICDEAFDFPVPLKKLKQDSAILELFHGPTCAFKDVGARFLAAFISRLQSKVKKNLTVIVATSGDTGGAVASAFHNKSFVDVIVLFPEGKISPRQETQLTCWGGNVKSFAVQGSFDDCQRMVKEAFLDDWWKVNRQLISANSISIGRILPQTFYYAWASLKYYSETGRIPGFIIPSGNLGNATACIWSKKMGFPIREIVMSTNSNRSLLDYADTGVFQALPTITTLANAMDVGNPSNIERIFNFYPDHDAFTVDARVFSVDNEQIKEMIRDGEKNWGEIFCPHTATAVYARERLKSRDWILVATAHPAKFESIVEPLIGKTIELPAPLKEILGRQTSKKVISASLEKLRSEIS